MLAALAGLAARLMTVTNHAVLTLAALSPYLMAGAAVSAVLLLLTRRRRTAAAAVVLVAIAVAVELPLFVGSHRAAANTVSVRVLTANVSEGQADPAALAALLRDHADIVMLQELIPELVDALTSEGVTADFPYQVTDARKGADGVAIWSRYPVTQPRRIPGYLLGAVSTGIQVPGAAADTTVVVVHIAGPWPQPIDRWRDEITAFPDTIDDIATQAGTGAAIGAGDFNATTDMAPMRRLLRSGFRDAAEQAGAGIAASFPADAEFPPVIAIDHVLTANSSVSAVRTVRIPGSDHLGLQAVVHLPSQ
jgi:endonuclease/exonuclease/phosphatase (EEP) superfamily protein YafD